MPTEPIRAVQRAPQRKRIYRSDDEFDLDLSKRPAGMAYAWKRVTLAGMEDRRNQVLAEMNGWTAVPAERHPELVGMRANKGESIIRGGQILMEQPAEYEKESRDLDKFEAKDHLETQIQRLGLQARRNGAKGINRTMDVVEAEIVQ